MVHEVEGLQNIWYQPMQDKIDKKVYSMTYNNPLTTVGGVEIFALNLQDIFREVVYFDRKADLGKVRSLLNDGNIVIVDNWIASFIGDHKNLIIVQHGCAKHAEDQFKKYHIPVSMKVYLPHEKKIHTEFTKAKVICSCENVRNWVWKTYPDTKLDIRTIHHHVPEKFFANRKKSWPNKVTVIGHDARGYNKGEHKIPLLQGAIPEVSFQHMRCGTEDRMRRYLEFDMFLHLSVTEGNSYACLEPLVLGIPILTTDVGLFSNKLVTIPHAKIITTDTAFNNLMQLIKEMKNCISEVESYQSTTESDWMKKNARLPTVLVQWKKLISEMSN